MNKTNYVSLIGPLVKDAITTKVPIMYCLHCLFPRLEQNGTTISTASHSMKMLPLLQRAH